LCIVMILILQLKNAASHVIEHKRKVETIWIKEIDRIWHPWHKHFEFRVVKQRTENWKNSC
jgi:hypothetical protein